MIEPTGNLVLLLSAGPAGDPRSPLVPTWLAITAAIITLLALAFHMTSLRRGRIPSSRRRIRTVNGWLMLVAIPVIAYAFGVAVPSQTRMYVLVWTACIGLLTIIVVISLIDVMNNIRLYRRSVVALRRDFHGMAPRPSSPEHRDGSTDAHDDAR